MYDVLRLDNGQIQLPPPPVWIHFRFKLCIIIWLRYALPFWMPMKTLVSCFSEVTVRRVIAETQKFTLWCHVVCDLSCAKDLRRTGLKCRVPPHTIESEPVLCACAIVKCRFFPFSLCLKTLVGYFVTCPSCASLRSVFGLIPEESVEQHNLQYICFREIVVW